MKTYRDLKIKDVENYADKNYINIGSKENFREAAKALFKEIQQKSKKKSKKH